MAGQFELIFCLVGLFKLLNSITLTNYSTRLLIFWLVLKVVMMSENFVAVGKSGVEKITLPK
jgi:hypothetical protein